MIEGGRVLALIPARGGSKGVPRKNLAPLGGRPLIAWTIEAALASTCIDRLILSSDDAEIIAAARAAGCEAPFVRPAELAGDTARSVDVIHHAMAWAEDADPQPYDYLVLLQPTSPLRIAADIDACIRVCQGSGAPAAVTVAEPAETPYWTYRRDPEGRLAPLLPLSPQPTRRQDLPQAFQINGAVYVARWDFMRTAESFLVPDTRGVEMPLERSIDIDTPLDLRYAELVVQDAARRTGGE